VEGLLRNLLAMVPLPQPCTKTTYRRIMGTHRLEEQWKEEHTKTFLNLKIAITSEPILRGPRWDGDLPTPKLMGWSHKSYTL
jgi:hypothetical protein